MPAVDIRQKSHLGSYDVMFLPKAVRLNNFDGVKCLEGDDIDLCNCSWPRHQFLITKPYLKIY